MKLNNKVLFIVILVVFFGGIAGAMVFNVWDSKPGKNATGAASAEANVVIATNPADIRGTNSFAEISQMFNIPLDDLKAALAPNFAGNFAELKARDLKTVYANLGKDISVETESVRTFAAMYKNLKYTYSTTAYLPQSAVKVLKEKAKLSPEQFTFLETHTIDVSGKN
jgi:hypothetical protein